MASASTAVVVGARCTCFERSLSQRRQQQFAPNLQPLFRSDKSQLRSISRQLRHNAAGESFSSNLWRGGRGPKRRLRMHENPGRPVQVGASYSESSSTSQDESDDDEKPPLWGIVLKGFLGTQDKVGEKVMASLLKTTQAPIGIYVSEPVTALHRLDPRVKQVRMPPACDFSRLKLLYVALWEIVRLAGEENTTRSGCLVKGKAPRSATHRNWWWCKQTPLFLAPLSLCFRKP